MTLLAISCAAAGALFGGWWWGKVVRFSMTKELADALQGANAAEFKLKAQAFLPCSRCGQVFGAVKVSSEAEELAATKEVQH